MSTTSTNSQSIGANGIFSQTEETFLPALVRLLLDQNFLDSQLISVLESANMTKNVGHSNHQSVHLARYVAIARALKINDIAVLNTDGNNSLITGLTNKSFTGTYTCTDDVAKNMVEFFTLIAIRKNAFDASATVPIDTSDTNIATRLSNERSKHLQFILQTVTAGVGSNWYEPAARLDLGVFTNFKISFDTTNNTISVVAPADDAWAITASTLLPAAVKPTSILDAASAVFVNLGANALFGSDMPNGAVDAEAALMFTTGKKKSEDLSGLTKADIQKMLQYINKTSGGGVTYDMLNLNTSQSIPQTAIGDCAELDSRVAAEIKSKPIDEVLKYASDSPKYTRPFDLSNPNPLNIFTYQSLVTRIVRALLLKGATNAELAKFYKVASLEWSTMQTALNADQGDTVTIGSTSYTVTAGTNLAPGDLRAKYTASGTADATKDKTFVNIYTAVVDARKTSETNFADLNTSQKVADYLGGNNSETFLYAAPANTTGVTTGVNNGSGFFANYLNQLNLTNKPTSCLDIIYDAFKLLAAQNNQNMNKYTAVEDIIYAWFTPTVSSQFPTTTPAITAADFWAVTTEQKAKRALAYYIVKNAPTGPPGWTLLSDPSNKPYFDLLIKLGKKSGTNVNPNQAWDLYGFDSSLMSSDCPKRSEFGTGIQMYEAIKDKSELSNVDKARLFIVLTMGSNDDSGVMNTVADIQSLDAEFGTGFSYNFSELLYGKDGSTSLITTANTATQTGYLSYASNVGSASNLYPGFNSNSPSHQLLIKRATFFSTIIDIVRESTSTNVRATFVKEIMKYAEDYQTTFVRYISNFNSYNKNIFKAVLFDLLSVKDFASFGKHISSFTYGGDLKTVVVNYIQNATTDTLPGLGLSTKSLTNAVDPASNEKLTPSNSYTLIESAKLALDIITKDPNVLDPSQSDTRMKLGDFKGTDGKQDMILICLIAALKDGGSKIRLKNEGKQELLEASVLISDIVNAVVAEWGRLDPWTLADKIVYRYLAGANADGSFVPE